MEMGSRFSEGVDWWEWAVRVYAGVGEDEK